MDLACARHLSGSGVEKGQADRFHQEKQFLVLALNPEPAGLWSLGGSGGDSGPPLPLLESIYLHMLTSLVLSDMFLRNSRYVISW